MLHPHRHSLRYCKRPRPHTSCRESSWRPREPALRSRRQDRRGPHPSHPRKGFRRQPPHHPATFRQDGSQQPARSLSHRIRHHLRWLREFRSRFLPGRMKRPRQREGPPAFQNRPRTAAASTLRTARCRNRQPPYKTRRSPDKGAAGNIGVSAAADHVRED